MQTTTGETMTSRYARWVTPAVGLTIGLAYLVAGWAGENLLFGLLGFGIMALFSLGLLVVARRSETVRGLLDRRDERISAIDVQATAITGTVLIVAIIAAFVVEIAQGQDGSPYYWLGAVGGVTYVLAVVVLRLRG